MQRILPLTICHQYTSLPFSAKSIKSVAEKIYSKEKVSYMKAVTLVLCSDYRIKKLNSNYREINRPTDVLSFCFGDQDFLGEIYISLQRAKVQALRYGLTYEEELTRLFVHGMFHLLGYDHIEESQRKAMETRERLYFKV
jgi:probable rRNA maturation factor